MRRLMLVTKTPRTRSGRSMAASSAASPAAANGQHPLMMKRADAHQLTANLVTVVSRTGGPPQTD